jgi:hypothetical protein
MSNSNVLGRPVEICWQGNRHLGFLPKGDAAWP